MNPSVAVAGDKSVSTKPPVIAWPLVAIIAVAWIWAFHAFSQYWIHLEQYAYGWLVPFLGAFFFWRRLSLFAVRNPDVLQPTRGRDNFVGVLLLLLLCAAIVPLELVRERSPLSRVIVWVIGINAVTITVLVMGWMGGRKLRKTMIFPTCFFLVSAPWITAVEIPLINGLAARLSEVITEVLHWLGFIAAREGTVIHMRPGRVGIDEACSGIRSLQSGVMYSIALGELFLLTVPRRWLMVALVFVSAMALNLLRTFLLCWAVDAKGLDILDKEYGFLGLKNSVHDWVGGMVSLGLPIIAFGAARFLAKQPIEAGAGHRDVLRTVARPMTRKGLTLLAMIVAAGGFLGVQGWFFVQDMNTIQQTERYFVLRPGIMTSEVPKAVLEDYKPTDGEYFQMSDPEVARGIHGFRFFWKPSTASIYVLGHRPDVCMTGAGWVLQEEPRKQVFNVAGHPLDWYVFSFKQGDQPAMQIWGVWRNDRAVNINYSRETFDRGSAVPWFEEASDRKSAMEIVSLVFYYEGDPPGEADITRVIARAFDYQRPTAKE